jgi:branched-chain amino acid transport system ATP-binding protein
MRMASGLLRPESGRVELDGQDVTHWSPSRRAGHGVCHVMEGRSIFPSLTVGENLTLESPRDMRAPEVLERTADAFPQLAERRKQVAGTLSGGEQQMLALMRAYLTKPTVVLVDEASLGLAPVMVDRIFAFLRRIVAEGVALLLVEQYVSRALALASTVYLVNQGRIVFTGTADELDEDRVFALYSSHDSTSLDTASTEAS